MNSKIKLLLSFLATILLFVGCQDRSELTAPEPASPVSGNADFTRYVSIGNSLTAGYQSSALFQSAQQYSFGKLIAQQVNTTFEQPLIADPGIGGQIKVVSLNPFVTKTEPVQGGAPLNLNYPAPYNNLGIPGIVLADVMSATSAANSYSHSGLIDVVLRGQGTVFAQAKALQPTLITLWIGNNDVLGFATSGGASPSSPTPSSTFGYLFAQLMDSLAAIASHPKIIVANIPNVTAIPFFTTVGPAFAQQLTALSVPGFYYQAHGQYSGTAAAPAQLANYSLLLTLVSQPYLAYFGKPSGKFYRDHNADISLLIAGGILDTTKAFGADPKNPIPDALILDASEITTAANSTTDFNNAISASVAAHSSQAALVNINSLFNNVRASDATGGYDFGGKMFTTTYVEGGLFSLDGVHPTSQGYAIVANEFLKVINNKFGSNYSLVDIGTIPGSLMFAKKGTINLFSAGSFIDPQIYKNLLF